MRAPLSWIREFTPVDAPSRRRSSPRSNQLGLEVEGVEQPGRGDQRRGRGARCSRSRKHPNADKLRLVDIDFGDGQTTRSCAARRTSSPGMVVPYAPSGATLPGGFTLERRKIRGEVSDGMLLLGRRSSGSATTTPASSSLDAATPSSAPTSATSSASTT